MADAEAEEKIHSELDVQLTKEADAGHVAHKTADYTLHEHKPLPTRNCREPCLQAGNLQTRGKNKSRSAWKNARQKASGVLVTSITGDGGNCVPDALCVLIPSFGILIHVEELQSGSAINVYYDAGDGDDDAVVFVAAAPPPLPVIEGMTTTTMPGSMEIPPRAPPLHPRRPRRGRRRGITPDLPRQA